MFSFFKKTKKKGTSSIAKNRLLNEISAIRILNLIQIKKELYYVISKYECIIDSQIDLKNDSLGSKIRIYLKLS
ncbi:hypothetical protein UA38_20400 [Photobacterium kishitanii]|uniref:Cell division topological specificity factor n=1 Tax=Photobacterium kishitanii TaxID=318456 RepID=A0AAX0Z1R4_9GAMM|nr:hypothetical protein [Photobacterium kishitanii]KJG55298.1 hypothetical protein UA38_20400 [Photobacterium kishitanii]KJG58411.1 hypothetical protein UA42_19800 [Photobacterium kishitanii]KJG63854.1 hypothetical protein UA40_19810 [Photobacterium kishitanii]KJG67343.1 hypothetical protein UA41_19385 [Photobacterium kishitanii]PSX20175.1 hypothetical protein C0W70_04605 [Photobacterium kishitanii]